MFYKLLGALWDVHGIVTAMLDTIDNTWEDKCKAGAYAALSIACSDLERIDQEKGEKAILFYNKTMSYPPFVPLNISEDWRCKVFRSAGKFYLRDFQHDKAISMFEKMMLFPRPGSPHNSHLVSKHMLIGNVLLNKGSTSVEAIEKFNFVLKILKVELGNGTSFAISGPGTGKAYSKLVKWSQARHHLETAYEAVKGLYQEKAASFHIEKFLVDQYCTDKQLLHGSKKQRTELLHTALDYARNTFSTSLEEDKDSDYTLAHQLYKEFTNKISYRDISMSEICPSRVYLYHAQLYYFLGKLQDANKFLIAHFEEVLKDKKQHCQRCLRHRSERICEIVDVRKCEIYKVACHCNERHFKLDWKRGRLGHKNQCQFLRRWRLVTNKKPKKKPKKHAVD